MPLFILKIADGGPAHIDGRLWVGWGSDLLPIDVQMVDTKSTILARK